MLAHRYMKKILGLDLGTTSIGWALVNQAEQTEECSSIIRTGVRENPLSTDEKDSFEKGKAVTTNSERRIKRSMRRNLQRYKLRRDELISLLKEQGWIDDSTILSEQGNKSTFETYKLRSEACSEEISLSELSRVLLMINKKRGYKSNRKTDSREEDHLFDGMTVAKSMYENGLTPGQYCLELVKNGKKTLPEFYPSDLKAEFQRVWTCQAAFHPDILTEEFKVQTENKSKSSLSKMFFAKYKITTAENKGTDRKLQGYLWRVAAIDSMLPIEQVAYVLCDIAGNLGSTSGYLGKISDRSKELYFNNQTVGQYLYSNIEKDTHFSVRNKVFYRQDYMDEFEKIWEKQSEFHPEMTDELKSEIRDVIIFYQRKLKSQKGLISFCELESHKIELIKNGKKVIKTTGCRVAPYSSPMFQEFRKWQTINNLKVTDCTTGEERSLVLDEMIRLSCELNFKEKLSSAEVLKLLFKNHKDLKLNFKDVNGNETLATFYSKYFDILVLEDFSKGDYKTLHYDDLMLNLRKGFVHLGYNIDAIEFNPLLAKEEYEQQPLFKLWHLLYSYEGDDSPTGTKSLIEKISELTGMPEEYSRIISSIAFKPDYGSLSHKAMNRILPHMMEGHEYSEACALAGYNHSAKSLTKEQIEAKELVPVLENIPKNSLRNPVVEKILNQMINVVNSLSEEYGKPDAIHIELARELKSSQEERAKMTEAIASNNKENERIERILKEEFHLPYVSRNDIVRYKLYDELGKNGYKTLYSNAKIPKELLFSNEIDIEHIIPQALCFNDSFSNKTLEFKDINREKSNSTAYDFVKTKYGEAGLRDYLARLDSLFNDKVISGAKYKNLTTRKEDVSQGFIERDLRDSQYIAKKAREILLDYVKVVVSTTGSVTARLREDWGLVDVMKELNMDKFDKAGKVETFTFEDGRRIRKISDWTKRNDHRHHAMDAITIAFTKPAHIQYLNNLSAKSDPSSSIYGIRQKETVLVGNKRLIVPPMPRDVMRSEVKRHLKSILVSIKAKNKVMTENVNRSKKKGGENKVKTLTPRGLLHKEQIYGLRRRYETFTMAVGGKMTRDVVLQVAAKAVREALMKRLDEFGGDAKKAFTGKNSIEKNPIWLDENHLRQVPAKVKCVKFVDTYSIRKNIDSGLSVNKVIDAKVKAILQDRLKEYGDNAAKAFSNLDENPIWLNKEKGIAIRKVTIAENFNLEPIREKRDKDGNPIKGDVGMGVPSDYVNFRNNHHVAIYEDESGNLQEDIVSFFKAVERKSKGLPVVDKEFNSHIGWRFLFTMKTNEMFVFPNSETGFDPNEIDLTDKNNYSAISPNLFKVQKLSSKYYCFLHHLETKLGDDLRLKDITWKRITSVNNLKGAVKVRINHIGEIVQVGEYD